MDLYSPCATTTFLHICTTLYHTLHTPILQTTAQQQQQGGTGAIGSAIGSGGLPGYGSVDPLGRELPVGAYGSSASEQQLYGDGQGRLSAEQAAKLELFARQRRAAQVYTDNTTISNVSLHQYHYLHVITLSILYHSTISVLHVHITTDALLHILMLAVVLISGCLAQTALMLVLLISFSASTSAGLHC
jgi:hypothetical protein